MYGDELDWPQDYTINRGNLFNFQFQVAGLNATGATVTMSWPNGAPGAGTPTTATITVVVAPNGLPTSTFAWQANNATTAAWTAGNYPYKIQYNDTLGNGFAFGHGAILVN